MHRAQVNTIRPLENHEIRPKASIRSGGEIEYATSDEMENNVLQEISRDAFKAFECRNTDKVEQLSSSV